MGLCLKRKHPRLLARQPALALPARQKMPSFTFPRVVAVPGGVNGTVVLPFGSVSSGVSEGTAFAWIRSFDLDLAALTPLQATPYHETIPLCAGVAQG